MTCKNFLHIRRVLLKGGGGQGAKTELGEITMSEIVTQIISIALPIILTSLMGYVVWLLQQQKKDRDANTKGTMLLLRVQLIEYHSRYIALGEIPSYAYDNFEEMHEAYNELGGNGMITKMHKEIQELHLKAKN